MSKIKTGIARLVLGASILAAAGSAFAAPPSLSLPPNPPGPYTGTLHFDPAFGLGSYFTSVWGAPAIPPGLDVVQGLTYKTWCVEFDDGITFSGTPPTATAGPYTFRNTLGTLPLDAQSANWGAVNWLLNNKNAAGAATVVDIQEAIWKLLNGAYHTNAFILSAPSATTTSLVSLALGHTGFVPAAGDVVAVLLDGGDGLKNDGSDLQSLIIEVTVPPQATGCPATQGYWHKDSHWPKFNGATVIDGITFNANQSMIIGGNLYTQGQLLALLPSGSLHTGGYVNALSQFIAAVLNRVAGAQSAGIDATITTINTDLTGFTLVTGTGTQADPYKLGTISGATLAAAALQATLNGFEGTLDAYNSATGLNCTEASGLTTGK